MPSISGDLRDAVGREAMKNALWRLFHCTTGGSNKFWAVRASGKWMETWWGRIGTQGQKKVKEHGSSVKCMDAVMDLVHQKLGKGYVEQESLLPSGASPAYAPAPIQPAPPRQREVLGGGYVAVYALRDVYGAEGRRVHARGHRQELRSAQAAEVVAGGEYGYWHPDEVPADQQAALPTLADAAAATGSAVQQVAEGFRQMSEVARRLPHLMLGPPERVTLGGDLPAGVPPAPGSDLFTEMDVSRFLANEKWRCYGKGDAKRWYIRQQGVYVETANTDDGELGPRRGRKFTTPQHARTARDLYIQAMEGQGFRWLRDQPGAVAPGDDLVREEPARKWQTLGPNDKRLAPIAWHVLVYTDAGQKDLYWRIRFTGRLLETWSGGNRPGSEAGVRAGRLYNREEDVLPDAHDLVLDKLRRGYTPQGPDLDDWIISVAKTVPEVWAALRLRLADMMKPRGTVALGRFSTIEDEEDIL